MTTMKEVRNFASQPCELVYHSLYDRVRGEFYPGPDAVERYVAGVNAQVQQIMGTMRYPEMIRMALQVTEEDGEQTIVPVLSGYEYVCARSKHPETTQTERNELKKVMAVYRLADRYSQLMTALDKRDMARINRILNGQRVVRS